MPGYLVVEPGVLDVEDGLDDVPLSEEPVEPVEPEEPDAPETDGVVALDVGLLAPAAEVSVEEVPGVELLVPEVEVDGLAEPDVPGSDVPELELPEVEEP